MVSSSIATVWHQENGPGVLAVQTVWRVPVSHQGPGHQVGVFLHEFAEGLVGSRCHSLRQKAQESQGDSQIELVWRTCFAGNASQCPGIRARRVQKIVSLQHLTGNANMVEMAEANRIKCFRLKTIGQDAIVPICHRATLP